MFSLTGGDVEGNFVFNSSDSTYKKLISETFSGSETGESANKQKDLANHDVISILDNTFTLIRFEFSNAITEDDGYSSYSVKLDYTVNSLNNMIIKFYLSDNSSFNPSEDAYAGSLVASNGSDGYIVSDGTGSDGLGSDGTSSDGKDWKNSTLTTLGSDGFVIESTKSIEKYVFMLVRVDNYDFNADFSIDITWNLDAITNSKRKCCFAKGTKVTMENGSLKKH